MYFYATKMKTKLNWWQYLYKNISNWGVIYFLHSRLDLLLPNYGAISDEIREKIHQVIVDWNIDAGTIGMKQY